VTMLAKISFVLSVLWCSYGFQESETVVVMDVNRGSAASAKHVFATVPPPSASDAASVATAKLISGRIDSNGASPEVLFDGQVAEQQDQPNRNFFLTGRETGRLLIDLGQSIEVKQFNSYSWHPDLRGPQVYSLFAADENGSGLVLEPDSAKPLSDQGWQLVAEVDTRTVNDASAGPGGQYAVSISKKGGEPLGKFRYFIMEISATRPGQNFSHTFFSEIDIHDGKEYAIPEKPKWVDLLDIEGKYRIVFDTTETPELRQWVQQELKPICQEWYPKIVSMLPSDGFEAPRQFTIYFHRDMSGVANASGTRINCAAPWFLRNLDGEAKGAVVHEMVHIVQQYRRVRGGNRNPGWMVEGIADYIRWFLYEPEENRPRPNVRRANFDDSYRTTAAFLDFLVKNYDPEIVKKFNASMREGGYSDELWTRFTEKTPEQLWREYVQKLVDEK